MLGLSCPVCGFDVPSSGMSHALQGQPFKENCECPNCGAPLVRFPKDEGAIGRNWILDEFAVAACPHCGIRQDGNLGREGPSVTTDGVLVPSQWEATNCSDCGEPLGRWVWPGQRWFSSRMPPPEIEVTRDGD